MIRALRWPYRLPAKVLNRAKGTVVHSMYKRRKVASASTTTEPGGSGTVVFRLEGQLTGSLIKRYKRFLADIQLPGEADAITAHCPNTGPMTGLLDVPMAPVLLSVSDSAKRKYPHTLQLIQVPGREPGQTVWVGAHSSQANTVVKAMLGLNLIQGLLPYDSIKPEVKYGKDGKSRVDFVLGLAAGRQLYAEVKSVTLAEDLPEGGRIALFPDTVSVRAQRHVRDLIDVVERGQEAACIFLIQRGDCAVFAPCHEKDPEYGRLLLQAVAAGVKITALRCRWEVVGDGATATLTYLGPAEVRLSHKLGG